MFYNYLLKPFLFLFYPEVSHSIALKLFKLVTSIPIISGLVSKVFGGDKFNTPVEVLGIKFKNPVGLAAGFDKDGKHITLLSKLGFGFIEIGTVTPKPQEGNPKPRLFRLKKDQALINRMGFNNDGLDALVSRLQKLKDSSIVIGGNIGKNKVTPNDEAYKDYLICFEKLHSLVDYFVVNVSSPNTPGLRALQEVDSLRKILTPLVQHILQKNKKPILLKIAPDISYPHLEDVLQLMLELKMDGIIIANTTIDRSNLKTSESDVQNIGAGGLSGLPALQKSNSMIEFVHSKTNSALPIIGVGGIHSPEHARQKLKNGASLVQLYTGFIYEGPKLIKEIKKSLMYSPK